MGKLWQRLTTKEDYGRKTKQSSSKDFQLNLSIDLNKKPVVDDTIFLGEAANKAFEGLFKNSKDKLVRDQWLKNQMKEVLKFFISQNFTYFNINIINSLDNRFFLKEPLKKINLTYKDDSFYIQVTFKSRLCGTHFGEFIGSGDVKGEATYKMDITPSELNGSIVQFSLVDSVIDGGFKGYFG